MVWHPWCSCVYCICACMCVLVRVHVCACVCVWVGGCARTRTCVTHRVKFHDRLPAPPQPRRYLLTVRRLIQKHNNVRGHTCRLSRVPVRLIVASKSAALARRKQLRVDYNNYFTRKNAMGKTRKASGVLNSGYRP